MNAEGIPPLPPEILEQTQKLKSLRQKPPSAVAKGITAAIKAKSDRLAEMKKPKPKVRRKKKSKPGPKPKR